jgi:repressor LexA
MPKEDLHKTQKELLRLLASNSSDPLSLRELQARVGASSPSVIFHHLAQLEKKGYLKRNPYDPRDYVVIEDEPEKEVTHIGLYGLARCGPEGSILSGDPIDRLPIASRLLSFPAAEAFMLKAKGDSMLPRIAEGDYVIARKGPEITPGRVYVCINDEECLIKVVRVLGGKYCLESLNREKYPIFEAARDFRVEGEVKHILSGTFDLT